MKKLFLLLAITILFTSCEKEEVEIPLSDQIMGNYTINTFQAGGGSLALPYTSSDGSVFTVRIVVTKVSETTVDLNVISKTVTGGISLSQPAISNGVTLSKTDGGIIQMKNASDGVKIAEVNTSTSSISVFGTLEGEPFTYIGSKDS